MQIALPYVVGLFQSGEGLNGIQSSDLPGRKGELLLPDCLELGHWLFPAFGFEPKHWLFLGLETIGLWTETTPLALLGL